MSMPGPLAQGLLLVLGTFASEDLTCITAGLLVRSGQLDPFVGLAGCYLGIFAGDLGLWAAGRLAARGLLRRGPVGRLLSAGRLDGLGEWFDRRGWAVVLAARFLPGTRLPFYVTAGILGRKAGRFVLWTALAALVWTPLLVFSAAAFGDGAIRPFVSLFGPGWSAVLFGVVSLYLAFRLVVTACTPVGRARLVARASRWWRWEFWPSWLFYLPVIPWLAYLSMRYRGALIWTAANPGIPHGGVVGESKFGILSQIAGDRVIPSLLVPPRVGSDRLRVVREAIRERGWQFPLILKPDAGQRGAGVKRVSDLVDVEKYLQSQPDAVIVQAYHPGPFEAGVFYYRLPGEPAGHIFSVTDKVFPVVVGDGRASLEELIWHHPRYRMQAGTFLARHDRERSRVPAAGEVVPLALAGNHCQGTMFRDGSHLITGALEQAIDTAVRPFPGFFVGRFDLRYCDPAAFKAGQDFAVVELNGVTSESTNIYDPSWSLFRAYRTLFRQWALLYRIGHANRARGHAATGARELLRLVIGYYRSPRVDPLAD
jgi:membrane protein DedA with SNARE-associated domain